MYDEVGLPAIPFGLDMHIVLVETRGRTVGLIVDQVLDVVELADGQVARPDDILPQELNTAMPLRGVTYTGSDTVLVLDIDGLFVLQRARVLDVLDALPDAPGEPQGNGDRSGPAGAVVRRAAGRPRRDRLVVLAYSLPGIIRVVSDRSF